MTPQDWMRLRTYDPNYDDPYPELREPPPLPFPWAGLAIAGLCVLTALAIGAGMVIAFGRLWG